MDRIDQILLPPVWKICFRILGWIWHAKNDLVIVQKFWEMGWPPRPFWEKFPKNTVFLEVPPKLLIFFLCTLQILIFNVQICIVCSSWSFDLFSVHFANQYLQCADLQCRTGRYVAYHFSVNFANIDLQIWTMQINICNVQICSVGLVGM